MSNPALLSFYVDNNPSKSGLNLQHSRTFVEGLRLSIVQGDIAISETDAIVVPTDEDLGLSGLVAKTVASEAGRGLNRQIDGILTPSSIRGAGGRHKKFETGNTIVVGGHSLAGANNIILVVSPVRREYYSESDAADALREAVKNVLTRCDEEGIATVTLPSIGSGLAGYDKENVANYMISAVGEYLVEVVGTKNERQRINEICFCLHDDDESLDAYVDGIEAYDRRSTSSSSSPGTKRQRTNQGKKTR